MRNSAIAVANRLLEKAGSDGLDPMKLIKLAYLCQGWMLGLYHQPLVWNDVEAWRYGPVFRELYRYVAGKPTIIGSVGISSDEKIRGSFDDRESDLIDQVYEKYGKKSGLALSALTHAPGSPWDVTYRERGQNSVIPKDLIEEYYAR